MQMPLHITFRGMEPSPALETQIRERAEKLEHYHPGIVGCRVVVETPHRRQHQGKFFHVRIDLTVPGVEIVVNRDPVQDHAHEDAHVAIRDAFDAARRRLMDHHKVQQGVVKSHA
jgi:ribosome-associated translation inhibitor RaiA